MIDVIFKDVKSFFLDGFKEEHKDKVYPGFDIDETTKPIYDKYFDEIKKVITAVYSETSPEKFSEAFKKVTF